MYYFLSLLMCYICNYMKIVKLNAIDSTNSYLKELMKREVVENWTVVVANHQTKGKGQYDNKWISDKGKNLTFSILVRFKNMSVSRQYYLNYSVSLAIYKVLKYYIPEKLSVKWPNDILSANHKICGILIENSINNSNVNHAVIGIGLNVNQDECRPDMVYASSIKKIANKTIDKDVLLQKILLEVQYQLWALEKQKFNEIKQSYEEVLYKRGIPSMFVDHKKNTFLGKIVGVTEKGKLLLELADETLKEFELKEIKFRMFLKNNC